MSISPLVRYAGDDWRGRNAFLFTYSSPAAGGVPGAPINLTGYVPSGMLFFGATSLSLTTANGRARLVDAAGGQFELSVAAADTGGVIPQTARATSYTNRLQVCLTDPSGNRDTLAVIPILVLQPGAVAP